MEALVIIGAIFVIWAVAQKPQAAVPAQQVSTQRFLGTPEQAVPIIVPSQSPASQIEGPIPIAILQQPSSSNVGTPVTVSQNTIPPQVITLPVQTAVIPTSPTYETVQSNIYIPPNPIYATFDAGPDWNSLSISPGVFRWTNAKYGISYLGDASGNRLNTIQSPEPIPFGVQRMDVL